MAKITFWKGTLAQYAAKKAANQLDENRLYFIEEAAATGDNLKISGVVGECADMNGSYVLVNRDDENPTLWENANGCSIVVTPAGFLELLSAAFDGIAADGDADYPGTAAGVVAGAASLTTHIDGLENMVISIDDSPLLGSLYKGKTLIAPQRLGELTVGTKDEDKVPTAKAVAEFVASFFAEGSAYEEAIKGITDRLDAAEGRLDTAEGDIDNLEGRMGTAEGDIDALEGRATTIEGKLTTAEGAITGLEANKANKSDVYTKEEITNMLSSALEFKGTVETVADLPETAETGDLYYVKEASKEYVYVEALAGSAGITLSNAHYTDPTGAKRSLDGTYLPYPSDEFPDTQPLFRCEQTSPFGEYAAETVPQFIYKLDQKWAVSSVPEYGYSTSLEWDYVTDDPSETSGPITVGTDGITLDTEPTITSGNGHTGWEELGGVVDYSVFVQKTTKVNGKALSEDITLTGDDIKVGTFDTEGAVTTIGGETTLSGAIKALDEAISGVTGGSGGEGGSLASKMDKVSADAADQILTASSTGNAAASGYKVGGETFGETAKANTVATEAAVMAALKATNDEVAGKMSLVASAVDGNIVAMDANGDSKDSGFSISSAETIADVANASATKLVNEKAVAVAIANATIEWIEG